MNIHFKKWAFNMIYMSVYTVMDPLGTSVFKTLAVYHVYKLNDIY